PATPVRRSAMSDRPTTVSASLVQRAADWLTAQALADSDLQTVVRGCYDRLYAAGVPIARGHMTFSMLHPLYRAVGYTWRRGQGLKVDAIRHTPGGGAPDFFLRSPYYHLLTHKLDHLRRRLDTGGQAEFPIFDDLRAEGLTDYLAFRSSFDLGHGQGMLGSWSTDQRGGFTDSEIESLLHIQGPLAVACKMATRGEVAKNALSTYLGGNAGTRVLSGQIKRGDGETIRAAIAVGDLRNSTQMAEKLGRQAYIDNLNSFFDATAGAIADAGGEILSFIGDGFLAIFPCGRNQKDSSEACKLALSAAFEAEDRMTETNRLRAEMSEPALGYGLGLHIGNVTFGNVGLPDRLAFSIFGSTVNEVARLESLTKKYATPIVASESFQSYCGGAWERLGTEALRGVDKPIGVFRPMPQARAVAETRIAHRGATRDLSQAEGVVLLHRDNPAP
ncbi:MAG: adenylate/guanylate cyclase domain-containing protein, partial [Dongiaceae bacterium]